MPPRFSYWTIIFGGQATSFRSASRDELLPTFKQIQAKHPDAQLRYFTRGKLWYSDEEAQAALLRERFEKKGREGRRRDEGSGERPRGERPFRQDRPRDERPRGDRPFRQDRPRGARPRGDDRPGGWQPKAGGARPRSDRPQGSGGWKPRGDRPQGTGGWKPRGDRPQGTGGWKPRGDRPQGGSAPPARFREPDADKGQRGPASAGRPPHGQDRKPAPGGWKPKGDGARGRDWRPGGTHQDPQARFKVPRDVKRARMAKKFGWKKKKDEK